MILLVEDDAISRTHFAETLRAYGYQVLEAGDGVEALSLLEKHRAEINLVIADMVLPRLNGLVLVTNIQTRWPKVPIIMLSAYLSKEGGDKIFGRKIDFLEKPVRPSALMALVGRVLPRPLN